MTMEQEVCMLKAQVADLSGLALAARAHHQSRDSSSSERHSKSHLT